MLGENFFSLRFGGNNPHIIPKRGLIDHGPFRRIEGSLRVRFIRPEGILEEQINKLKDVLLKGNDKFPGGFEGVYRVKLEMLKEVIIRKDKLGNPLNDDKFKKILCEDKELSVKPIYVIVVPPYPRWFKKSPYCLLKAYLTRYNIMSQMVTFETLYTKSLVDTAFNMANAIFAKAGGEPWRLWNKVPSFSGSGERVIIIGTGLSNVPKEPGHVEYNRYAGFVVLYSDEGQLLSIKTFVTEYSRESALKELKRVIIESLNKFSVGKEVDIIIHYSGKNIGGLEEKEIAETLKEIERARDIRVKYIVLRIITNPLYRVFSLSENGYPPIGLYIQIGEKLILTYTLGSFSGMVPLGVPTPLLLSLRLSNIPLEKVDREALVASICEFARLNWRGVSVFNREPVTIKYSRLLAYLAASIKEEMRDLDLESLPSDRAWFL